MGFGSDIRITKSLFCVDSSCGGPGYVVVGTSGMTASGASGYRMIMSTPGLTNQKLRAEMQRLALVSSNLAPLHAQVTDVRKGNQSIRIGLTFDQNISGYGKVYGLATADVTESKILLSLASAPTVSKARERLGLAR